MIITIARECGCYGDEIGAELAKRLGVLLFDKKKILELAHDVLNAKGYHPARMTDQAKCIGCAMCAMMCPDCVIKVEKE